MTDAITAAFYAMPPENRRPEHRRARRGIVPPVRVAAAIRQAAAAAVEVATLDLGLPRIVVRWLAPLESAPGAPIVDAPINRQAFVEPIEYPDVVFLKVDALIPFVTVLHESRHLWQWANGWYPEPRVCDVDDCGQLIHELTAADEDRMELDAYRYEHRMAARYGVPTSSILHLRRRDRFLQCLA